MFRLGLKSDTIQFWIMVCGVLTVTGSICGGMVGFAAWADARYMKASAGKTLGWEVHALYMTIPDHQRLDIEKKRDQYLLDQDSK